MTNHKTFEQQTFTLHLNQDGNFTLETSDKIHLKLPSKSVKTLASKIIMLLILFLFWIMMNYKI